MIGLVFYGAILLWLAFAVFLALKLPKWLGIKEHPKSWSLLLGALIFFLPVLDEILAYPQIRYLCRGVGDYEFVPGVGLEDVRGYQIYHVSRESLVRGIFPQTVVVQRYEGWYKGANNDKDILYRFSLVVKHGWLRIPAGSSGDAMPLLVKGCAPKQIRRDSNGAPAVLSSANVKMVSKSN
jgi:hypothetical protein